MAPGQDMPWNAVCSGCEYPLRGLGHPECPECGLPFDPGDIHSFRRLGVLSYARKAYSGKAVVTVFILTFIAFLMLGVSGFYLL